MKVVQSIIVLLVAALLVGLIASSTVQGQDLLAHKYHPTASKKPTVKASPTVKHLQVRAPTARGILATSPKPTVKPTVKPTAKPTVKPTVKPTAKPTKGALPTPAPTVKRLITMPDDKKTQALRGGSVGMSGKVPLMDSRRYAGRGPGLVNGVVFPRPPDAPAPFSKPLPSPKVK
jgi:hypothetical protein